jgi:hypothetical protein
MQQIESKNLLKEIVDLKKGEVIYIDANKDVCNRIKLLLLQKQSCENLFTSYVNSTCEEANKLNLDNFIKKYTELSFKTNDVIKEEILKILGTELYKFILENNIKHFVNYQLNRLQVYR